MAPPPGLDGSDTFPAPAPAAFRQGPSPAGFPRDDGRTWFDQSLGRHGSLEVRLASSPKDVRRAQRLRYKVFFEEGKASPIGPGPIERRDVDPYDAFCDHLLVLDHDAGRRPVQAAKPKVVGTYRLLRQEAAAAGPGFYSAGEFDIAPLLARHPGKHFLELGRSCVLKPYRGRKTVELLWAGIWSYVRHHRVDAMFGCASLDGTDPDALAGPLSFLHHHAPSPPEWRVRALPERYVPMGRIAVEALDAKAALRSLPPLVKAYLRVGATFGDGAVVDPAFGTTDVFVTLPVASIASRYLDYFGPAANRFAA